MTCNTCRDLSRPGAGQQVQGSMTLDDLRATASQCSKCKFLVSVVTVNTASLEALGKMNLAFTPEFDYYGTKIYCGYHTLKVDCETRSGRPQVVEINLLPIRDLTSESQLEELKARIREPGDHNKCSPYTASKDALEWATEQVRSCSPESEPVLHAECPLVQPVPLPDRILSLGNDNNSIRLHVSSNEPAIYATLSHSWGGYLPIKLTTSTLATFTSNIPWTALPKTFQDAITVTRLLNIRYIWIDSLCIIQDSALDWATQSAKMAAVYSQSSITLAATAAHDCRDGLFSPDRPSLEGYVSDGTTSLPLPSESFTALAALPPTFYIVREFLPRLHADYSFGPSNKERNDGGLLDRGWVYQERLLSPRVLHFGQADLWWECNARCACQCGQWRHSGSRHMYGQFPKTAHRGALGAVSGGPPRPRDPGPAGRNDMDHYRSPTALRYRWQRIVVEFGPLALTFETDRIPAVAGVAHEFATRLVQPEYSFGVWREFWAELALWHIPGYYGSVAGEDRWLPLVDERKVPSWSWASVRGGVRFEFEELNQVSPASWKPRVRDPTVVSMPWSDDEADRLLGNVEGDLVVLGHLTKTRLRKYVMVDGKVHYGVCRSDGTSFYGLELDVTPPTALGWTVLDPAVDPVWTKPPAEVETRNTWDLYRGNEESLVYEDRLIFDYRESYLRWYVDDFESCQQLDEPVWCLFTRFWDGPNGKYAFLLLKRVAESPDKFCRVGVVSYKPTRLPLYDPIDFVMQEVTLV
ncbi:heterokaryon incompatibility protein-domain-containing protein [Lasiosphaeria hispida]|uniref:Heterokaryon incompatibility protein-domain-containing protein n=1 Tax=Lasiosphaeria hispida TaxID=260671 RepID=A0AAJ0MFF5_9PEZI|nr:heterokaryon incompatibility protein-domain-containing protein [Lasiosphaeria hispida]